MHVNLPLPLACVTTFLMNEGLLSNKPACCASASHNPHNYLTLWEIFDKFLPTYFFQYYLANGMQNCDDGSPSIILARYFSENAHNS